VLPFSLAYLQRAILLRQAWQVASACDVLVTANNEADFGCRGIQYVNFPCRTLPRPTPLIPTYRYGIHGMLEERWSTTSRPIRVRLGGERPGPRRPCGPRTIGLSC
jgi:hypothetical protein